MRILITGITGFIGSHLSHYLSDVSGMEITGVSRNRDARVPGVFRMVTWDDLASAGEADGIIHLAGIAADNDPRIPEEAYRQANVELTRKIYAHFLNSGAGCFIFFSSIKAVASRSEHPLKESDIPVPSGAYGRSKLDAETILRENPSRDGQQVIILRPAMIHGPGSRGNLYALYRYLQQGYPWPFPPLPGPRSYLSLENLLYIIHHLLTLPHASPITDHSSPITDHPSPITLHLSDDTPLTTSRIVELMGETMGKQPRILPLPPALLRLAASAGSLLHLPLNRATLGKLTDPFLVSNEAVKKEMNITSLPVSAEQGLRKTLQSYRKNPDL